MQKAVGRKSMNPLAQNISSVSKRRFPKNLNGYQTQGIAFALAAAIGRFAGLALVPLYTRRLKIAELGVLAVALAASSLLQMLSSFSLDNSSARWLGIGSNRPENVVSSWFWMALPIAGIVSAFCAAVALVAVSDEFRVCLLLVALNNVLVVPTLVASTCFRQMQNVKPVITASLLGAMASLLGAAILVAGFGFGPGAVILSTCVGSVLSSGWSVLKLRGMLARSAVSRSLCLSLLKFGFPLVPGIMGQWASALADRFILKAHHGTAEVGRYQVAQYIAAGPGLAAMAFQAVWGPWAMSLGPREDRFEKISAAIRKVALYGSLALVLYAALAPEIARLLAPNSVNLLPDAVLLSSTHVLLCLTFGFSAGPMLRGQTKRIGLAMFLGGIVNMAANLLLIGPLGLRGATIATVSAYAFVPLMLAWLTRKSDVGISVSSFLSVALAIATAVLIVSNLAEAVLLRFALGLAVVGFGVFSGTRRPRVVAAA
jgi:O-antigen/teichoic acid export membrane protein